MAVSFRSQQRRFVLLGAAVTILVLLLILPTQSDHFSISPPKVLQWSDKPASHIDSTFDTDAGSDDDYAGGSPTLVGKPAVVIPQSMPPHRPSPSYVESGSGLQSTDFETTSPLVPKTLGSDVKVGAHTWGFNVLDKLYLRNGTFYVVTKDGSGLPTKQEIIERLRLTTPEEEEDEGSQLVQFITPSRAKEVLGNFATVVSGVNFMILDTESFLTHFYHFWGEVIIGVWRVYSTLALSEDATALDRLPFPSRMIMPYVEAEEWRDRAQLNGPIFRLAFPDTSIETSGVWRDWKRTGSTVVFERSVTVNRNAAHKSPLSPVWYKMIGTTMNLTAPLHFWEPIRKSAMKQLFGYVPEVADNGRPVSLPGFAETDEPGSDYGDIGSHETAEESSSSLPIVTYISRQDTGRRLLTPDHEGLVSALRELEEEGVCVVRIPVMEDLSFKEQFAEIASSTIIVGVHGNGLTHQMFMPPSLRSAVFEIQYPGDWAFDYWMLSHNLGHKHYMVRNDTLTTYPPNEWHDGVHFSDNFHGDNIPVYGPVIADMIRKRLTQPASEVEV